MVSAAYPGLFYAFLRDGFFFFLTDLCKSVPFAVMQATWTKAGVKGPGAVLPALHVSPLPCLPPPALPGGPSRTAKRSWLQVSNPVLATDLLQASGKSFTCSFSALVEAHTWHFPASCSRPCAEG